MARFIASGRNVLDLCLLMFRRIPINDWRNLSQNNEPGRYINGLNFQQISLPTLITLQEGWVFIHFIISLQVRYIFSISLQGKFIYLVRVNYSNATRQTSPEAHVLVALLYPVYYNSLQIMVNSWVTFTKPKHMQGTQTIRK